MKDSDESEKDKLLLKWLNGEPTSQAELADPTTAAEYAFCLYVGTANALLMEAAVLPGFDWSPLGDKGYRFKFPAGLVNGITKVTLKGSDENKSKAVLKGKGENLPDPILGDLPLPVRLLQDANVKLT